MAASTGSGWAQLRQQARSLETQVRDSAQELYIELELTASQTDTLFHTYSQFASLQNVPAKPTEDEQRVEAQLQDMLEKVSPLDPPTIQHQY